MFNAVKIGRTFHVSFYGQNSKALPKGFAVVANQELVRQRRVSKSDFSLY